MAASPATSWNAQYIEAMYQKWQEQPDQLDPSWQMFFEGFDLAQCGRACVATDVARDQSSVASLIFGYRNLGHRVARVDPLGDGPTADPALELAAFGFGEQDLDQVYDTGHLGGPERAPLREIISHLQQTYCRSVGVEYLHLQDTERRRWLQAQMEPTRNTPSLDREQRLEVLRLLIDAELFETFIGQRYPGQKRFSLEGAESVIPAIHAVVEGCSEHNIDEIVMGMAHRGRLNVLANILDKSYSMIFSEFEENLIPSMYGGDGDVKYHQGYSADHVNSDGRRVHLSLTANPSHLEVVGPVVQGRVRARQRRLDDTTARRRVLPLLIHGDAAFAGQGLVAETLNLSQLEGYRTGGTLHIIINNQIGFTTSPGEARSTRYCTDVAKMIEAPVFHVNGDDPEAVVHATRLALAFRQRFSQDVVLDMVCYRRHGHNEGDEPAFTQPVMYEKIKTHSPVRQLYTHKLLQSGDLSPELDARIASAFSDQLQRSFEEVHQARTGRFTPVELTPTEGYENPWVGMELGFSHEPAPTAAPAAALVEVGQAMARVPEGFNIHRKVARQMARRAAAVEQGGSVDWGTAEALAFGTLLLEGIPVRLSGQDSARGTFSHRHSAWIDTEDQRVHKPLNHVRPVGEQARFCVYNSLLSEAAVLGFEYGYAHNEPQMLLLWEAQFGDFANGAQVVIDQFLVASHSKWERTCGLVLLLPHGYEGQGPEHSNAYLERYLQACAEDNIQVCNLTTPAQYFHALRRQVMRPFRRPLVIMAPKSLLRHKAAVSPVEQLSSGRFNELLDDPQPPPEPTRLVLCSGKLYYDLLARREEARPDDASVVLARLEQLYPLHQQQLTELMQRHAGVQEVVWAQEEPRNRGGWTFIEPHLRQLVGQRTLRYAGRRASASAATGTLKRHREQQQQVVEEAMS